jgi:hypothetical protein
MTAQPGQQFGRKAQLVLIPNNANSSNPTNSAGTVTFKTATPLPAIDLSDLHFTFEVVAADTEHPNLLTCRVYNLGDKTVETLIKEYSRVVLQAGYEDGNYGVIFRGDVAQYKVGKENNVDGYLDILAGDGDLAYNFGFCSFNIPAGATDAQIVAAIGASANIPVSPDGLTFLASATGGTIQNPRGQVAFGLARTFLRDIAKSNYCRWSIQNGQIVMIPLDGYLPGEAVVINSATGMVGVPEANGDGVKVRCLLNPKIQIGQRIHINQKDVAYTQINNLFYPNYASQPTLTANVTRDGFYRVMVAEHSGDTRGQDWYTDLICLAIDPSTLGNIVNPITIAATQGSVQDFGG